MICSPERHIFGYGLDASEALSLTMPLRTESYSCQGLLPVFQMNLPEGHLRQVIERATAKRYGSDDLTMPAIFDASKIGIIGYAIAGHSGSKLNLFGYKRFLIVKYNQWVTMFLN